MMNLEEWLMQVCKMNFITFLNKANKQPFYEEYDKYRSRTARKKVCKK